MNAEFQRFLEGELARLPAFARQLHAQVQEHMRGQMDQMRTALDRQHAADAMRGLREHATHFERLFVEEMQERAQVGVGRSGLPRFKPSQMDALSLVDEGVVDESIEVSRVISRIEDAAEWEQRELLALLSTLRGETAIAREANPLRAEAYARAYWHAVKALPVAAEAQRAALRLGTDALAQLVRRAFVDASARLNAAGVQPAAYRAVRTPVGGAPGGGAGGGPAGVQAAVGAGPDVVAGRGAPRTGAGGLAALLDALPIPPEFEPTASGRSAKRVLSAADLPTRPLEQVLRQIEWDLSRTAAVEATMVGGVPAPGLSNRLLQQAHRLQQRLSPDVDPRVIELMSRLFDRFLADPAVPAPVRGAIGRLQVSALRVALTDASLLDGLDHPVWRFIDRLAAHGAGYVSAEHPQWQEVLRLAEEIIDDVLRQQVHDRALYVTCDKRLQGFQDALLAQWLDGQAPARKRIERAEQVERWRGIHRARVTVAVQDEPLSATLHRFLVSTWVEVLARATADFGEHVPQTRAFAELPVELAHSLRPLRTEADRSALVAALPDLLSRMRAGMELVDWPQARRKALFDELVGLHADILRGGDPLADAARRADPQAADSQFQTQFGDESHAVDVHALDTVPADLERPDVPIARATPSEWVDTLVRGRWYRLFIDGQWTAARHAWRSPRGGSLLFEGDAPGLSHALTRRALERLYAEDLARELEPLGMVARAVVHLRNALA